MKNQINPVRPGTANQQPYSLTYQLGKVRRTFNDPALSDAPLTPKQELGALKLMQRLRMNPGDWRSRTLRPRIREFIDFMNSLKK
jgi:hypothetical protein